MLWKSRMSYLEFYLGIAEMSWNVYFKTGSQQTNNFKSG